MSIFQEIANDNEQQRRQRLTAYYQLLKKSLESKLNAKERAWLADLMAQLGKLPHQAETDQQSIAVALRNEKWAGEHDEADKRSVEAYHRYLAVCKERQDAHREWNEKVTVVQGQHGQAQSERDRSQRAKGDLKRLREADPVLYDAIFEPANEKGE